MVPKWYHHAVAMNLRLREELHEKAARRAELERRSLNALISDAVAEYLDRRDHAERVQASADKMLPRYADTLRRLGE
jgi:predicted transcriptional regulator